MNDISQALQTLSQQEQFLDVVDRDEASRRFHRHLKLAPIGSETVGLAQALGRILAQAVVAGVDVPGFDRSSVDGFAVHADDTVGASDRAPRTLTLNSEILTPGTEPQLPVTRGTATLIATGGMVPRGADAVVMVEHTDAYDRDGTTLIEVRRPAAPGQFIAFAGSDLARGETVLLAGRMLTSREIGMLAAVGCAVIEVWRKPRVAIISTGDEIIAPGEAMRPGAVYDSNAAILAAAVEEAGGIPQLLGIGPDDEEVLSRLVGQALASCDMVILSGGTSAARWRVWPQEPSTGSAGRAGIRQGSISATTWPMPSRRSCARRSWFKGGDFGPTGVMAHPASIRL
jgi:putative molybdopterin biosynthesis protein